MIKKIRHTLGGIRYRFRANRAMAGVLADGAVSKYDVESEDSWANSISDPTGFYEDCVRFFHRNLAPAVRTHREYFRENGRSFGEDSLHVMWYLLCRRFRPATFMEIGVYRGQTLSLVALLSKTLGFPCGVFGLSPFLSAGDSVSVYNETIDYLEDTKQNFRHFHLKTPTLWRHFSNTLEARELVSSRIWDCIYIDGNHDYEVALSDWELCSANTSPKGIIVLDDSALGTSYRPPAFATGGHPGPSRLATEIDPTHFCEILRVGHNRVFQKLS